MPSAGEARLDALFGLTGALDDEELLPFVDEYDGDADSFDDEADMAAAPFGGDASPQAQAKPMDDGQIKSAIQSELEDSIGYLDTEISEARRKGLAQYRGAKLGNEEEGRSQVVMQDVREAVDWMMPSLMRIFFGGSKIADFQAEGPEDEEGAKQATKYINWSFVRRNSGFITMHNWFKDALIEKNGTLKVYVEETRVFQQERYDGLTEESLAMLLQDEGVELDALDTRTEMMDDGAGQRFPVEVFDVVIANRRTRRELRVDSMASEEFLISRKARSINSAAFCCHRKEVTISDLVAMGFPYERVRDLPESSGPDFDWEHIERWIDEEIGFQWSNDVESVDPARRTLWLYEAYMPLDVDGDGFAELRKILFVGESSIDILENEPVTHRPFASLTHNPLPHKFHGESVPDIIGDIQEIRTTLVRQMLDNIYLTNNQRLAVVDGQVEIDDILDPVPGGYVRQDAPGMIEALPQTALGPMAMEMFNAFQDIRENRIGITRYNQGTDSSSLNQTATGILEIMNAANMKIDLVARIFAETGVTDLFRLMLRCMREHFLTPQMFRLRGEFHEVDPSSWNDTMDVEIEVGLGTGQSIARVGHMGEIFQMQEKVREMGLDWAMLDPEKVFNVVTAAVEEMGFKIPTRFFNDPRGKEEPERPPDPQLLEAQSKTFEASARVEHRKAELELQREELQQQGQIELARIAAEVEKARIQAEASETTARIAAAAQRATANGNDDEGDD